VTNASPPAFAGSGTTSSGLTHCAYWRSDGALLDCHFQGTQSIGLDLNDSNVLVGRFFGGAEGSLAFRWTEAGGGVVLPPLPGLVRSRADAINNDGVIVGVSEGAIPPSGRPPQECTVWEGVTPIRLLDVVTNPAGWQLQTCFGITTGGVIGVRGTVDGSPVVALAIPDTSVIPTPHDKPTPYRRGRRR
jgi:hypothetical protein